MRSFVPALTFLLAGCTLVAADMREKVDVDPDVNVDVEVEVLVSHDGTCGNGTSCYGSQFGGCCDASGCCGSTKTHCGYGCQLGLGYCEYTVGEVSPDGTCGGSNGYICEGSRWGPCCSQWHFCGSGPEYCEPGDTTDHLPADKTPLNPCRVLLAFQITTKPIRHPNQRHPFPLWPSHPASFPALPTPRPRRVHLLRHPWQHALKLLQNRNLMRTPCSSARRWTPIALLVKDKVVLRPIAVPTIPPTTTSLHQRLAALFTTISTLQT